MGTKEALIYVVGSANRRGMDAPRANQREGRDTSNAFDDDESRALGNVSSISTWAPDNRQASARTGALHSYAVTASIPRLLWSIQYYDKANRIEWTFLRALPQQSMSCTATRWVAMVKKATTESLYHRLLIGLYKCSYSNRWKTCDDTAYGSGGREMVLTGAFCCSRGMGAVANHGDAIAHCERKWWYIVHLHFLPRTARRNLLFSRIANAIEDERSIFSYLRTCRAGTQWSERTFLKGFSRAEPTVVKTFARLAHEMRVVHNS
jgi:hypothetical protein